jgi:hypothetical protein
MEVASERDKEILEVFGVILQRQLSASEFASFVLWLLNGTGVALAGQVW